MSSRTTATRALNRSRHLRRRSRRYSQWPYVPTSRMTIRAPRNVSAADEPTVVIERQAAPSGPNVEQNREIPSQPVTVRTIRNDSPSDFVEVAEAEGLDRPCLDRRDVRVGLVGAKRRANDGAGRAAAPGLTHELGDGLC